MKCPECGSSVRADHQYCRECGANLDLLAAAELTSDGGLTATLPLMAPGATSRNVLVALLYLVVLLFFFWLIPFYLAYAVGTNRHGWADRLADSPLGALPPIEKGGWQAALTVFVAVVVLFAIVGAALPGTDAGPPADGETVAPKAATPGGGPAPTAGPTATATATPTAVPTDIATTTPTATPTPSQDSQETSWTVTVIDVIDGDTMDVRMPDGSTERIRLLGVDTPETGAGNTDPDEWEGIPDTDDGRSWLASWGDEAKAYAESRLGGKEIYIETDSQSDRRESYGRLLVYASQSESSSKSFNLRLIENGYARMYDTQFEQRSQYQSAEETAQRNNVGVWNYSGSSTPTPTADGSGGSADSDLAVSNVHADAEGDDHDNLNDEYVEFTNEGNEAIELTGWMVEDEANHDYYFPSGFTLDAGATVTLYTGSGEDTDDELYWGESQAVWNNGGDTIYVRNDAGETVIEYEYSG